jgi:integrase
MLPEDTERLIKHAGECLIPLLIFLIGTGARMAEAIYVDWRDIDLDGGRARFWPDQTKGRKVRNAMMPPRVVAALAICHIGRGRCF